VKVRLVDRIGEVGLYEVSADLAWSDYLYVVFKARREVGTAITKIIYSDGKWLLPLPTVAEDVELIYVGPVEGLRWESSEGQHAGSEGVALGNGDAVGGYSQ